MPLWENQPFFSLCKGPGMWIILKPIALIHVPKALLGQTTENEELGLAGVCWLWRNTRWESPWLIPAVKAFTGQQKKHFFVHKNPPGILRCALGYSCICKIQVYLDLGVMEGFGLKQEVPFPLSWEEKGRADNALQKFSLLYKLHRG